MGDGTFRYREGLYLDEVKDYIQKTYGAYYVGSGGLQAIDAVIAAGNGLGFTVGNVQKYSFRYGKKGGYNRDDLRKLIHYAVLALFCHDQEIGGDGKPKETG